MMTARRTAADDLTARFKKIVLDEFDADDAGRDAALSASIRLMLVLHIQRCGLVPTIEMLRDLADVIEADVLRRRGG